LSSADSGSALPGGAKIKVSASKHPHLIQELSMTVTNSPLLMETVPVVANRDGVLCVAQTRVTLDTLIQAFQEGATAEEIAQQYPTAPLADVYSVIGYYLRRQAEIEAYLARRRQAAERVRQQNEARFNPVGIRARLLARRSGGND
jgi:uncharacterized protein (DUF433 family)